MTSASFIRLTVEVSLALTVLDIGSRGQPGDATWLLRRPALLGRSIVSMYVVMPLFALATAYAFNLHQAVKIALVALAVSPVPPILPNKQIKAGGSRSYSIGLLVAASVLAIVFVPFVVWLVARALDVQARLLPAVVGSILGKSVLLPLLLGLMIRRSAPRVADRFTKPLALAAMIALMVAVIAILVQAWNPMMSLIGNGTLLAIIITTAVGLFTGHALGGPVENERTVLALATSLRHPAIAIAVGQAAFPDLALVPAAVLLSFLVATAISIPYKWWIDRARQGQLLARLGLLDRRRSSPGNYSGVERRAGSTRSQQSR
jgi:BASS family bile acid:Na+ symporter